MLERAGVYDISPRISEATAVFPGDHAFARKVSLDMNHGDHLGLSSIHTTLHVGAHADAPSHYRSDGLSIDRRSLSYYLGACEVIAVRGLGPGERIRPHHVGSRRFETQRVLFKTGSFPDSDRWQGDFNSFSPELVDWLHSQGVRLIGIDTPSVDPAESKALESHQTVARHDMAVLEGLVLSAVPEGRYVLVALPLPLKGADASPVRAVLLDQRASESLWRS